MLSKPVPAGGSDHRGAKPHSRIADGRDSSADHIGATPRTSRHKQHVFTGGRAPQRACVPQGTTAALLHAAADRQLAACSSERSSRSDASSSERPDCSVSLAPHNHSQQAAQGACVSVRLRSAEACDSDAAPAPVRYCGWWCCNSNRPAAPAGQKQAKRGRAARYEPLDAAPQQGVLHSCQSRSYVAAGSVYL